MNIFLNPSKMLDTRYNVNGLKDLANTNMVYTKHFSAVLAIFVSNIAQLFLVSQSKQHYNTIFKFPKNRIFIIRIFSYSIIVIHSEPISERPSLQVRRLHSIDYGKKNNRELWKLSVLTLRILNSSTEYITIQFLPHREWSSAPLTQTK